MHRLAAEWAFARAGRRIDRAVADAAEPRRTLGALRDEVVAGALELAHVRSRARLLRPGTRTLGSPYPGLAGFGPGDTELFHGRGIAILKTMAQDLRFNEQGNALSFHLTCPGASEGEKPDHA